MLKTLNTLFVSFIFITTIFSHKAWANKFIFPQISTNQTPCWNGDNYSLDVELEIKGIQINTIHYDNGVDDGDFTFDVIFSISNTFTGNVSDPNASFYTYNVTLESPKENINARIINQAFNSVMKLTDSTYQELNMRNNSSYSGSASQLGLTENTYYTDSEVIKLFGFESASLSIDAPCLDEIITTEIDDQPLNIKLNDFHVDNQASLNVLRWTTSGEKDNAGFEIERSIDAKNWEKIGWVNSQLKNSQLAMHYEFIDHQPQQGWNYYRLKQIDYNNSFEYSEVRSVEFISLINTIEVYPNPASTVLHIKSQTLLEEVQVINVVGQEVLKLNAQDNQTDLVIDHLNSGVYYLHITLQNGVTEIKKIMIK